MKLFLLLGAGLVAACANAAESLPAEEFSGVLARSGGVYIAGQPTEEGLSQLKEKNVTTVVNLRTPMEMEALSFDEAAEIQSLGMEYVFLPSGGANHPYSRETLDAFAKAVDEADGDILLHCRSATRASHLWVAYLVKHKGVPMAEALAEGKAIHFGTTPIEGYLEGEIGYEFKPSE